MWKKFLNDQLSANYFREFPSVPSNMVITPDGDSFDKVTGTINFYVGGIIPNKVRPILNWLVDDLMGSGMKIGEVSQERSKLFDGPVIRIPVIENPKGSGAGREDRPPELNMANGNAFFIFNKVLGYDRDLWESGTFDVGELKRRIGYYKGEERLPEGGEVVGAPLVLKTKEEMADFFGNVDDLTGRSGKSSYREEEVRGRLGEIEAICDWAIGHGYKEIYLA
jgi:hypothetical protein